MSASPLDSTQLRRIEALHRGFLYQHLFAVACLLRRPDNLTSIAVERDEDVELMSEGKHKYVQVKTRAEIVSVADVRNSLDRFKELRKQHQEGLRSGTEEFWIVANAPASPTLVAELAVNNFHYIGPGSITRTERVLPGPWSSVEEAITDCMDAASSVPFTTLQPQTLVWKLASIVAYASTGSIEGHKILVSELPSLCEQFIEQLHALPEPPVHYYAQDGEPTLANGQSVILVVALSGGGKTAWIAQACLHTNQPIIFCDATGLPDTAIFSVVLREATANLGRAMNFDTATVLMPGSASLDGLRALNRIVRQNTSIQPVIVIDNAHLASTDAILNMVQATPSFSWVLLAQPWPGRTLLDARLQMTTHELAGWSCETVGKVFGDLLIQISLADCDRILGLTGGLPLFVAGAAKIITEVYFGDTRRFCQDIELALAAQATAQSAILSGIINRLSEEAKTAASIILLAELPLALKEAQELLMGTLSVPRIRVSLLIQELRSWGLIQTRFDSGIIMHDAFRAIASQLQMGVDLAVLHQGRSELAEIYFKSFGQGKVDRLVSYCKLLLPLGRQEVLPGIVSIIGEHLQELGRSEELIDLLIETANNPRVKTAGRFLAADTAAFWMQQDGDKARLDEMLSLMAILAAEGGLDPGDLARLAIKQMTSASDRGDVEGIQKAFMLAMGYARNDHTALKVLRYNYAVAQFKIQRFASASEIANELRKEYEIELGINFQHDIQFENPSEIRAKLGKQKDEFERIKWFGDVLDLEARIAQKLGEATLHLFLNAHKLYVMANAPASAVKCGLDYVFDAIELGAVKLARQFMEQFLIPLVAQQKMLHHVVPVHSQYAVVLAYDGDIEAARRALSTLTDIAGIEHGPELDFCREIVEKISKGLLRLPQRIPMPNLRVDAVPTKLRGPSSLIKRKIGRNEPCPCGSEVKYKKCCGL